MEEQEDCPPATMAHNEVHEDGDEIDCESSYN